MADYGAFLPVNLITGCLGSGKTTLLNRLLKSPALAATAVLVNEFGEVGLDHLLIETVDRETVILAAGCVCCTIRGDLRDALRELLSKRARGLVPRFTRIAIETTGLADPVPVVSTLIADPVLRHHLRLGSIVTTVDVVNGPLQLRDIPEALKQVAVADRIVLTKSDLTAEHAVAALRHHLTAVNPTAVLIDLQQPFDPDQLLAADAYDPARKSAEVRGWLAAAARAVADHPHRPDPNRPDPNRHGADIRAFSLTFGRSLDWTAFGLWLSMLLHAHGHEVLRVKGILNVTGVPTPVVIHGVQHVVHPPAHLEAWPTDDRRSHLVFIVRGLEPALIERSLRAFNRLANPEDSFLDHRAARASSPEGIA
jgi:G3E family GTPase